MATGKVIWDPGHGGRDPGAISPGGLREKDLVLDVAQRIARLEPGFGGRIKFHFTRLTDTDLAPKDQAFNVAADLRARSNFANEMQRAAEREDRLFVSIHMNADASRSGRGVSVWSYPGSTAGAAVARIMLNHLAKQMKPWVGLYGSGLFTANFHVLRETVMPANLLEAGFIGTQAEAEQLAKPVVRQHIAEGAVLAVAEHFGERYIFISDNDRDYEHFDWNTPSGATEAELERAFAGTAMAGLGPAFLQAEREHGVHAIGLAALAAWESAWASSRIARDKHNLFGYGASDDNPYGNARPFASKAEGILFVAGRIRRDYLNRDGQFHHGSNLTGMNVRYATDQNWRHGIATLWGRIRPFESRYGPGAAAPDRQQPVPAPAPTPAEPAPAPTPGPAPMPGAPGQGLSPEQARELLATLEQAVHLLRSALNEERT